MKTILVTGGLGYIGSHICVMLLNLDYKVIVVDNLSNSTYDIYDKIVQITGKHVILYTYDINDKKLLSNIFSTHQIDNIIHLAGLKSVNESVQNPLVYYHNNVSGTIILLQVMKKYGVKNIIFSSSATVYKPGNVILTEESPLGPINPYGYTKYMVEQILIDSGINCDINYTILRYFNPIGHHSSKLIGNFTGNNIIPKIYESLKTNEPFCIYGNDYNTPDGTCLRDYIHVMDLADAHIHFLTTQRVGIYNVGTGIGTSVLQLVNKLGIPYIFADKREGDTPMLVCDISKITALGWKPTYNIDDICRHIL
jgi:UDP-glucose 4-epimerase